MKRVGSATRPAVKEIPGEPIHFATPAAFRAWLRRHHASAAGIVVRIARKHAAGAGISYSQALDEALCYGWIDGVRRRFDAESFTIRFTRRKPGSIWSRRNVEHAERLARTGRMAAAGLKAFAARTSARSGVYSFEQRPTRLTRAQLAIFRKQRGAWAWYRQEAPWYRRTSSFWVLSAKRAQTRERRLAILIACSARGERIPPLRRSAPRRDSGAG